MVAPLDAITVLHNAFRRDLTEIDEAVCDLHRHAQRMPFHARRSSLQGSFSTWHSKSKTIVARLS